MFDEINKINYMYIYLILLIFFRDLKLIFNYDNSIENLIFLD